MIVLGLLPPYSLDDVHKAYKAKALIAHPDRGGAAADFLADDRALHELRGRLPTGKPAEFPHSRRW